MGGAAGSELWGATDRIAAERLGAALLGNILSKSSERNFFSDIYQNCSSGYSATILLVATMTPLPAAPTIPSAPLFSGLLRASLAGQGRAHVKRAGVFPKEAVKGQAFGSPLVRVLYPRASTAEMDPRANPGPRPLWEGRAGTGEEWGHVPEVHVPILQSL